MSSPASSATATVNAPAQCRLLAPFFFQATCGLRSASGGGSGGDSGGGGEKGVDLLIDVRSSKEWAEGHAPGAVRIPVQVLQKPDWEGCLANLTEGIGGR